MRTPRTRTAALEALYARIPDLECQGRCWDSCGPIRMVEPERSRIRAAGVHIPDGDPDKPAVCPALTILHRCAVYELRPLICRLWGVVESLRCPFGCRPVGGYLSDQDAYLMIADTYEIGGDHAKAAAARQFFADAPTAARSTAILAAYRQAQQVIRDANHRRATTLYVMGPGRLSRTPPPSGANTDEPGRG